MRVTLLGTGTLVPEADRASTGLLVEGAGLTLPIDLGRGVLNRMVEAGTDPLRQEHFFFTHLHADHSSDLVGLLFALRNARQEASPVDLFGPAGLAELVARIGSAWPSTTPDYPLRVHETGGGCLIDVGLRVEACPVHHGGHPALGFRIIEQATGRVFAFTGDSGPGPDLVRLAEGAHLLVAECGDGLAPRRGRHLDTESLIELVEAARVGRVAVVHLDPRNDRDAVLGRLTERLGNRLIEGRDGLRLEV